MAADGNNKKFFDPGLCRCCGGMKKCRLLNVEYTSLGQKEVYADMMMDCFGLLLSHLDGKPTERLVCATCVVQLRSACDFRRQVLLCEEAFQRMKMFDGDAEVNLWGDGASHKSALPKIEVEVVKMEPSEEPDSPRDSPAEDMLRHSDAEETAEPPPPAPTNEDSTSNDDVPLLQRLTNRKPAALPARAAKRPTPTPGVSGDTGVAGVTGVKRGRPGVKTRPLGVKNGLAKASTAADKTALKNAPPMSKLQQQHRERDVTYVTETNILNIVEFSFVCPFKCRHNNLLCYYCGQHCQDPDALRHHTLTEHDPKKFKIVEHKKMIKVDVTRIDCRLCDEKIDNLELFKRHITKRHSKKYYFGYTDSVLPFRLTKDELACTLCDQKYPYFHALNKHMNVHFSNYVCETCGLGFVDKCRFVMHQQRHEDGDFPCEVCGKMFRAQYNRDLHIDRVHNKKGRVYCPKCDIKLMSYPQKLKHLVEVHGEAPLSFPCNMCDKVHLTRRMLTIHRRKDHLKDYRYECQCCGQKFFTRFALNNHMPTHTGERNFKCKVCEKSYPRLKTLKDHMRIHSNDRRYRCHVCGQAFIQNCSLKGHMKSQHAEYIH